MVRLTVSNVGRSMLFTHLLHIFLLLLIFTDTNASLLDWVWWGSSEVSPETKFSPGELPAVKVPFEVNTEDEKFLEEAKKYTSLKLSDLDSCQHHIVMQIRNSCADMTEEDLAKMSVNLLNCQSAVEGRQQFPCTKSMSLRECTSAMDSDMWNTYHLMNNRARAVCYAARHQQFRALSEMTVNKLMDAAANQLDTMNTLKDGQNKLASLTTHTVEKLSIGHKELMSEQEKLRTTQRNLQDFVALNLRQLTREKALIAAGQQEVAKMANAVNKLEMNTEDIIAQLEAATQQYESALQKLVHINNTVNYLLEVIDKTREELDERLGWLTDLMGGTGEQLERLYSCILHAVYLVVGMIMTSFVGAPVLTRACLVAVVPLNLAVSYHQGESAALNFPSITVLLILSAGVHFMIRASVDLWKANQVQPMYLQSAPASPAMNGFVHTPSPVKMPQQTSVWTRLSNLSKTALHNAKLAASSWTQRSTSDSVLPPPPPNDESSDTDDVLPQEDFPEGLTYSNYGTSEFLRNHSRSPTLRQRSSTPTVYNTPPTPSRTSSRSGTPRPVCRAICRNGQQCRNSAVAGDDVCRRHALDSSFYSY